MSDFKADVLILPGLGNSEELHWQTLWEKNFGFQRVQQTEWETPVKSDWIKKVDQYVLRYNPANVILVGHSLACCTIVFWAQQYHRKIKGALLVAPSDTEAETYPPGTTGFKPMPDFKLSFPCTVIASENDPFVTIDRAKYFASRWGGDLYNIGDAGHINVSSGFGEWEAGLAYLRALDKK
jgi:uncharacterized protein